MIVQKNNKSWPAHVVAPLWIQGQAVADGRGMLQALEFPPEVCRHGILVDCKTAALIPWQRLVDLKCHADQVLNLQ